MASRARQGAKVLEWAFGSVDTTDSTVTNERIALGLRDDEIAAVHKVDAYIEGQLAPGADDEVALHMLLSMDPDVLIDPSVSANHDDEEVFFEHALALDRDITTEGQSEGIRSQSKISDFDPPILLGTDVGMSVEGDAAEPAFFWCRVYFTRRKATAAELNQILLKRR